MNATTKIILGALATTALAWWLHGPMGFGERCAAMATGAGATGQGAGPVQVAAGSSEASPSAANGTATTAGAQATANSSAGCQARITELTKSKTVNFGSGGAAISAEANALLDSLANEINGCANATIEIGGHSDATGGAALNMRLSEARASAIAEALVGKGVSAERLVPKGYGSTRLLDPEVSVAANARNRRIEFVVSGLPANSGR